MPGRVLSILSTFSLLPAARWLLDKGSALGLVYLASFAVTLAYHASYERDWRRTDHVLAYGVIGANTFMVVRAHSWRPPALGLVFVLLALVAYRDAKLNEARYDRSHALWHVLSGVAGLCFALGYA
jgi:heme/copper-type cytochrome/quinol oxidase subunit 3